MAVRCVGTSVRRGDLVLLVESWLVTRRSLLGLPAQPLTVCWACCAAGVLLAENHLLLLAAEPLA